MAEKTMTVTVTGYGWPDNDPPNSSAIAYPGQAKHSKAGGTGTYDDPITFAADPAEFPVGTLIYVPHVRRYFIMEDWCSSATANKNDAPLVDLWVGGENTSNPSAVLQMQESITDLDGATIIVNPDPGKLVITGSIYDTGFTGTPTTTLPLPEPNADPLPGGGVLDFNSLWQADRTTIETFDKGDKINLSAIDANMQQPGNQDFEIISGNRFSRNGEELRFEKDLEKGVTYVYGSIDHDRDAEFKITVTGLHDFTKDEFIL
jgi:3D (Asp-Asp-Asp) domain-containing protein